MLFDQGRLVPQGLRRIDPKCIRTPEELVEYIDEVGFLPLFKTKVTGFSAEEFTVSDDWWTGTPNDPWIWREKIAAEHSVAYGKFFGGRAGFISKKWFPVFSAYRRNGYDFDSLYEDGLAPRRSKLIMDVLETESPLPSIILKNRSGFVKGGEKGFEGAITALQMQTYVIIYEFRRKINKRGEAYGMPCSGYAPATKIFTYEHITSKYSMGREKAYKELINQMKKLYKDEDETLMHKEIK